MRYELARPIPSKYVRKAPRGKYGDYVPHYIITQALLAVSGPFDWDLVEILRGKSEGDRKDKDGNIIEHVVAENVVVGVVYRLTVNTPDGRVSVSEVGNADNSWMESDDGSRLKKATSDALKRCAMRLGVGLHMWCKTPDEYFLARVLKSDGVEVDHDTGEVIVGLEHDDV